MATLVDYISRDSRPKKPLVLLWGESGDLAPFFKKPQDIKLDIVNAGVILGHSHTEPLFSEKAALWVEGTPDLSLLTRIVQAPIHQSVIFNCVTPQTLYEFDSLHRTHIQVVTTDLPTPGSKAHKDLIVWSLKQEFPSINSDVLLALAEVASPHFGVKFFKTADILRKFIYSIPKTAFISVSSMKAELVRISPEKWSALLEIKDQPFIFEISDYLFSKSRNLYPTLAHYLHNTENPLPLINNLINTTHLYLESAWAIREAQGKDARAFVQGRKVPLSVFHTYQTKVMKSYGDRTLWRLLKDLCLTQARYKSGEKSPLPLVYLFSQYIGSGV